MHLQGTVFCHFNYSTSRSVLTFETHSAVFSHVAVTVMPQKESLTKLYNPRKYNSSYVTHRQCQLSTEHSPARTLVTKKNVGRICTAWLVSNLNRSFILSFVNEQPRRPTLYSHARSLSVFKMHILNHMPWTQTPQYPRPEPCKFTKYQRLHATATADVAMPCHYCHKTACSPF